MMNDKNMKYLNMVPSFNTLWTMSADWYNPKYAFILQIPNNDFQKNDFFGGEHRGRDKLMIVTWNVKSD